MKVFLLCVLLCAVTNSAIAQIDLHKNNHSRIGITKQVTEPISKNVYTVYNFTVVVIVLCALAYAQRIYYNWQMGNDNVIESIARWFYGLILAIVLLMVLQHFTEGQDFNGEPLPKIRN
jgi:RsiW-degrading membrane proteinase PrsW (M82 family)